MPHVAVRASMDFFSEGASMALAALANFSSSPYLITHAGTSVGPATVVIIQGHHEARGHGPAWQYEAFLKGVHYRRA
jgi:hypothetical protein